MSEQATSPDVMTRINGILDYVEQGAKATGSFVAEQTPIFIQELVTWSFWTNMIQFIVGVMMIVYAVTVLRYILKAETWKDIDDDYGHVKDVPRLVRNLVLIASTIAFAIAGPINATSGSEWVKIKLAPRVWLLEKGIEQVKKLK